ncbi:MAG: RagB/SusD family nutrient uptake outer membrane protein [Bacteroidaceae bacterium]|nr:RagB/SusD family nutrient uptake outer membrane protein [Bacteroidaceae bacterium]
MKKYITIILGALLFISCDDFLDIRPTGMVIAETGEEYRALLTDVYSKIPEDRGLTTLRSDEMAADATYMKDYDYESYFDIWNWTDYNRDAASSSFGWRRYYHSCYIANYIIEHRNEITKATQAEIDQLVGECYMIRAYMHFLLVNLYAPAYTHCEPATTRGVPLQLEADVNAVLKCSSVERVYKQVLKDIDSAEKLMNVERWDEGLNYRFNTTTVHALRARVALYMGDWGLALQESKKVIGEYPDLEDLNVKKPLLPTNYKSVESIMALEQIMTSNLVKVGYVDPELVKKFRNGDSRFSLYFNKISTEYPTDINGKPIIVNGKPLYIIKYGYNAVENINEVRCTFRAAEFYLIAAEAANELNETEEALQYIEALMKKRYTTSEYYSALKKLDQNALRDSIANERQREFAYQGHRWFDLRRTTQPELKKSYEGVEFILEQGDDRYTMRFPSEAVAANPELENRK